MYIGNRLRKDEFLKILDRSSRCELSVSECEIVYVCFYRKPFRIQNSLPRRD